MFPLHQIAHVGVTKRMGLKLFGRDIIFEIFQPVWNSYLNVTDRWTDRQTTYCSITALCTSASRGKNDLSARWPYTACFTASVPVYDAVSRYPR